MEGNGVQEWSGDWNGKTEPLTQAFRNITPFLAASDNTAFTAKLGWGEELAATYHSVEDVAERLRTTRTPDYISLHLRADGPKREDGTLDPEMRYTHNIIVRVESFQVSVAVVSTNRFMGRDLYRRVRNEIEANAVTKVPHHLRGTDQPVQSSRWTRIVGWIEQHPVTTGLIGTGVGALIALATLIATA